MLNTKKTQHHLYSKDVDDDDVEDVDNESAEEDDYDDIDFPHIIEISGNGCQDEVRPPWPGLLRCINELTISDSRGSSGDDKPVKNYCNNGGIISGIILAADALHKRTAGKKFQRRIVVITDAEQEIKLDNQKEILIALDKLREMECQLQVVGFDFERTSDYNVVEAPIVKSEPSDDTTSTGVANVHGRDDDDNDDDDDDNSDTDMEEEEASPIEIKRRNEDLLHKLSAKTGGFVFTANDKQSLVNKIWGSRVFKSSKKKLAFEIAPGVVLEDIRCYLMIGTSKMPSLKTKIAVAAQNGQTQHNSLGDEMVQDFVSKYEFWKADDEGTELTGVDISEAYRFGTDYIPYNPLDEAGLSWPSNVKLTICGYMPAQNVLDAYLIGEPYILTGVDSRRACAAISALAQALHRSNKIALATFVKTKDKDPILMGVFPLTDKSGKVPTRLMMIQLPFTAEIKDNEFDSLDSFLRVDNPRVDSACDKLIDSMILPDDVLDYTKIDNPSIESFYRTTVQRVLDSKASLVPVEAEDGWNKIDSEKAGKALEDFEKALPRKEAN
jgi:ATP-dependent DNA helicase 2 subunit 2